MPRRIAGFALASNESLASAIDRDVFPVALPRLGENVAAGFGCFIS
jgi:hypothetical protein